MLTLAQLLSFLGNPKVHYRVQKRPQFDPIPRETHPGQALPSHFNNEEYCLLGYNAV
jgi:hypothetical protein